MPANSTASDTLRKRQRTNLVRGGIVRSGFGETSEAIFLSSGYCYASAESAEARFKNAQPGFVYSRFGNPTVAVLEQRLALLEGAEAARATASGKAAVNAALMSQLRHGDRVVAARALRGSPRYLIEKLLPRMGIETVFVDGTDIEQWRHALARETRCVFFETPANPRLDIVDIAAVAALAHRAGARVIVDNVSASCILQRPLAFGADIVVYSSMTHVDEEMNFTGGAVLADAAFVADLLTPYLRHTGPALSPFNAWILLKALETVDLRIRQRSANATRVADFLAEHPTVLRTIYPGRKDHPQHALANRQMQGAGGLVVFEIDGDRSQAFRFIKRLRLIASSNHLGDASSQIIHPATMTHYHVSPQERAALGIRDSLLRLSVGLEDADDIIDDLAAALAA